MNVDTLVQGIINLSLSVVIIFCAFVVYYNAIPKWIKVYKGASPMFIQETCLEEEVQMAEQKVKF